MSQTENGKKELSDVIRHLILQLRKLRPGNALDSGKSTQNGRLCYCYSDEKALPF